MLVTYFVCITCGSHCCKCRRKGFDLLSLSEDEMGDDSPQEKLFDDSDNRKNRRGETVTHKPEERKHRESHSTHTVGSRHHSKRLTEELDHCRTGGHCDTMHYDRDEGQPKTHQHHHSMSRHSTKRTSEDTTVHDPEKHRRLSHGSSVSTQNYQGMENKNVKHKVLSRPPVQKLSMMHGHQGDRRNSHNVCFHVPSKRQSSGTFSHHHSSRFSASKTQGNQRGGSQDASSFVHQSLYQPSGPLPPQYSHKKHHITAKQPHPLQHASSIPPGTFEESARSAAFRSNRSIAQSSLPRDSEGHSHMQDIKSHAGSSYRQHRDSTHYQFKSEPTVHPSDRHYQKMHPATTSKAHRSCETVEHEHSAMVLTESSGSTISPEENTGTQALQYTTSASGFEKPFSHATDEYYSPFESDGHNDDATMVTTSMFTRSSDSMFVPIRPMPSKQPTVKDNRNILSSNECFDFISLSSSTSQAGGGGLDSGLEVLQ